MASRLRVGIIGVGRISGQYFKNAANFPVLDIVAVADLDMDRARAVAAEQKVPRALTVDQLLADPDIDITLNLTIPKAHTEIALRSLEAGKHTFAEKPLALNTAEGKRILETAKKKGLRVGCAPDTFMGAGIQTARKMIDQGQIGRPVAFTAFMMNRGHESWHPSPEFYYEQGGGPMFDMGPYYLTALLQLLGPVKRITGAASIAIPERTITSEPKRGKKITVETPDHIAGTIEFENGVIGSIITSFATRHQMHDSKQPITIWGTDATLRVPDPNGFDGAISIRREADPDWQDVPHAFPKGFGRAVGLADMAHAILSGRPHRASAEQAFAVLELMEGFLVSAREGKAFTPTQQYDRPAPMPARIPYLLD